MTKAPKILGFAFLATKPKSLVFILKPLEGSGQWPSPLYSKYRVVDRGLNCIFQTWSQSRRHSHEQVRTVRAVKRKRRKISAKISSAGHQQRKDCPAKDCRSELVFPELFLLAGVLLRVKKLVFPNLYRLVVSTH